MLIFFHNYPNSIKSKSTGLEDISPLMQEASSAQNSTDQNLDENENLHRLMMRSKGQIASLVHSCHNKHHRLNSWPEEGKNMAQLLLPLK